GATAEAVEGAEGHVLLVGGAAGRAFQLLAGQSDEPLEIALPQLLRSRGVPGLQPADPLAYGFVPRHQSGPPTGNKKGTKLNIILPSPPAQPQVRTRQVDFQGKFGPRFVAGSAPPCTLPG